jgi:uncharacterized membrane protein YqjE
LFTVEFEEENGRLLKMVIFGMSAVFLGMMGLLMVTGTIIFLVPEPYRLYAAIAFSVLYLGGAAAARIGPRHAGKPAGGAEPFQEIAAEIGDG